MSYIHLGALYSRTMLIVFFIPLQRIGTHLFGIVPFAFSFLLIVLFINYSTQVSFMKKLWQRCIWAIFNSFLFQRLLLLCIRYEDAMFNPHLYYRSLLWAALGAALGMCSVGQLFFEPIICVALFTLYLVIIIGYFQLRTSKLFEPVLEEAEQQNNHLSWTKTLNRFNVHLQLDKLIENKLYLDEAFVYMAPTRVDFGTLFKSLKNCFRVFGPRGEPENAARTGRDIALTAASVLGTGAVTYGAAKAIADLGHERENKRHQESLEQDTKRHQESLEQDTKRHQESLEQDTKRHQELMEQTQQIHKAEMSLSAATIEHNNLKNAIDQTTNKIESLKGNKANSDQLLVLQKELAEHKDELAKVNSVIQQHRDGAWQPRIPISDQTLNIDSSMTESSTSGSIPCAVEHSFVPIYSKNLYHLVKNVIDRIAF